MTSPSMALSHDAASHRQAGVMAVLAATLFWSFGGVLGKSAGPDGLVTTFWRMWVAVVVLAVVCAVRDEWPTRAELRRLLVAGALFGLNIAVFFIALERITVANALVIAALAPVLMIPIAARKLGEQITPVKLLCAGLAVIGVVVAVLAAPASDSERSDVLGGSLMAVSALVMWVGYLVASKRTRATIETVPFMFSVSFIGAFAVSAVVLVRRPDLGVVQGTGWLWVVLLAIGPGIAGHGLLAWAQDRVDASVSTVLMQAESVGATIAAYALLDEDVSLVQGLAMGAAIVALSALACRESRELRQVITPPSP